MEYEKSDRLLNKFLKESFEKFISFERMELIEQVLNQRTEHLQIVLENIRDAHNSNAIIRTGECLGIQHFHIIENENKFKLGKQSSRGAIKWVDIHRYETAVNPNKVVLNTLKESGLKVAVCSPDNDAMPIDELPLEEPTALLFGNERDGCSAVALEMADYKVRVPMHGFTESFNVSVAAGILLHSLISRLRKSSINYPLDTIKKEELRLRWYRNCLKNAEAYEEHFLAEYRSLQNKHD